MVTMATMFRQRGASKRFQQQCHVVAARCLSTSRPAAAAAQSVTQRAPAAAPRLLSRGGSTRDGCLLHNHHAVRRYLSDTAQTTAVGGFAKTAHEMTAPSNPAEHTCSHQAMFYLPTTDAVDTMLATVSKTMRKKLDGQDIKQLAVMVREQSLTIVDILKTADADANQTPPRIVISGAPGTGKSMGLLHVADWCRAAGWAVAYIPSAPAWVDTSQTILESVRDTSRMDQNVQSAAWLPNFLQWNRQILSETMVADGYDWDANAKGFSTDGMTLERMAEVGVEDNRFACDMVGIMLKQMVDLSNTTPMLLAIDGYNAWLRPSYENFEDFTYNTLDIHRASLLRHFSKLMLTAECGGLKRGGVVLAESPMHVQGDKSAQDPYLESSVRVQYSDYTTEEFRSYLDYHEAIGWIHKGINNTNANILSKLTKQNPKILEQMLKTL